VIVHKSHYPKRYFNSARSGRMLKRLFYITVVQENTSEGDYRRCYWPSHTKSQMYLYLGVDW